MSQKTILVTGATDGIGRETATRLCADGHKVLLHGRNPSKLRSVADALAKLGVRPVSYVADLSDLPQVENLAAAVMEDHPRLDVLINNAGVFNVPETTAPNGMDVRYVVNAVAPYILTQRLRPLFGRSGRVVNLSSAAQSPIDDDVLSGRRPVGAMQAYAQSKLALTMWSCHLGRTVASDAPAFIAVNPGSMLGTKMVKDAFGVAGGDVSVGAKILQRAALGEDFADARGAYFDNDEGRFASPHPDALDAQKCTALIERLELLRSPTH